MTVGSLGAEVRRGRLLELLARDGAFDLSSAAEECGVSEMTIRRDLAELERTGVVRRVRGGAVAVSPERFERRAARHGAAKARIAEKLLTLQPQRGFVALDSSSTVHGLAKIWDAAGVTVFTTGLEAFQALRARGARTILCGGELEEATGALVGPLALRAVEEFHFARSFVGAAGLDAERGAMESTIENAELKRVLRRASASVVLAVDTSKLELSSSALALRLAEIDVLVTECDPADPLLDPYRPHVELL